MSSLLWVGGLKPEHFAVDQPGQVTPVSNGHSAVPPVLPAALLPDGTSSEAGTVVGRPDRAVSGH
jgi:hypothetical protein